MAFYDLASEMTWQHIGQVKVVKRPAYLLARGSQPHPYTGEHEPVPDHVLKLLANGIHVTASPFCGAQYLVPPYFCILRVDLFVYVFPHSHQVIYFNLKGAQV